MDQVPLSTIGVAGRLAVGILLPAGAKERPLVGVDGIVGTVVVALGQSLVADSDFDGVKLNPQRGALDISDGVVHDHIIAIIVGGVEGDFPIDDIADVSGAGFDPCIRVFVVNQLGERVPLVGLLVLVDDLGIGHIGGQSDSRSNTSVD